jgi:hypothetical protein
MIRMEAIKIHLGSFDMYDCNSQESVWTVVTWGYSQINFLGFFFFGIFLDRLEERALGLQSQVILSGWLYTRFARSLLNRTPGPD